MRFRPDRVGNGPTHVNAIQSKSWRYTGSYLDHLKGLRVVATCLTSAELHSSDAL